MTRIKIREGEQNMNTAEYLRKIFEDRVVVAVSAVLSIVYQLVFPERAYLLAAVAVLGIIMLDLITKLFALSRTNGGLLKAIKKKCIKSRSFARGTMDKLIVFSVMLIICGLLYRISPIKDIAIWFTQLVFALQFFRDALSILENLNDAGIKGLGALKRALIKKRKEYGLDEEAEETVHKEAGPPDDGGSYHI